MAKAARKRKKKNWYDKLPTIGKIFTWIMGAVLSMGTIYYTIIKPLRDKPCLKFEVGPIYFNNNGPNDLKNTLLIMTGPVSNTGEKPIAVKYYDITLKTNEGFPLKCELENFPDTTKRLEMEVNHKKDKPVVYENFQEHNLMKILKIEAGQLKYVNVLVRVYYDPNAFIKCFPIHGILYAVDVYDVTYKANFVLPDRRFTNDAPVSQQGEDVTIPPAQ
jgi:hypothetical protein